MHISKFMRHSIAMIGMAWVGGIAPAVGGTNSVPYAEPFTNAIFTVGYAITNAVGWSAGGDDTSQITNQNYALPFGVAYPIMGYNHAVDNKVLHLNTGAATLTNTLGHATFAASPLYVDTMVNFVLNDDIPTVVSNDVRAKAAVFANATSNLVIFCGAIDWSNPADLVFAPSRFVVTSTQVTPGVWYRLTITLDSFGNDITGFGQAFEVRLNGTPVWSDQAYGSTWKTDMYSVAPTGGTWFLSAANKPGHLGSEDGKTLVENLAFRGTGFIDDLVVTKDQPVYTSGTWFTISQTIGANGSGNMGTGPINVLSGGNVSITYTADDWHVATATGGTFCTATNGNGTASVTLVFTEVLADTTASVVFNQKATGAVVPLVPTQYGLDSGVTTAWAAANPVAMQTGYMLNIAPTTHAAMEIDAIDVQGSNLNVRVRLSANNVPVNTTLNGTLWVHSTTNLAVGFTGDYKAMLQGASFTNGGMREVIFTDVDPAMFYRARITLP